MGPMQKFIDKLVVFLWWWIPGAALFPSKWTRGCFVREEARARGRLEN